MNTWTRKQFLKTSLVGGSAALFAGSGRLFGQAAPAVAAAGSANGDIRIAVVGINGQGAGHIRTYYNMPGARLVAICDVDSTVLAKRLGECEAQGLKPATYTDYRKLLESPDIDAVVLGTPNHQHALQTIWGLQAGKDVYVEKPLSHNVWEGRQAVEAARNSTKNIVYAGTQNRSSRDIMEALAYVRSGKLGKIQYARGLCYKERNSIGLTTGPQPIPASIDYDQWTGPAALVPSRRNSPNRGPVHYDWHWIWNYGGGDMTNQGIHQMDVARWFLGEPGLPPTVFSMGGRFGYKDDAETPNTQISVFGYEKAPLIFEVRGLPMKAGMKAMDAYRGTRIGVIVQCEGGYVAVAENGTAAIYDNDNKPIQRLTAGGNGDHRKNWIQAVRDRKVVNAPVEECHYSSALCHLGNLSYLVGADKSDAEVAEAVRSSELTKEAFGRMLDHLKANEVDLASTKITVGPLLQIDTAKEMFKGSETTLVNAANNHILRKRVGRGPYVIPEIKSAVLAGT